MTVKTKKQKKLIPKLRFSEFFGEWEEKRLGDVAKIYDGTHQTPNYQEKGIPFYSVEHLTSDNFKKTKYISRDVFESENKRVKLEKGDILMTRIGDIGTSKYISWNVSASFYVSLALIKQSDEYDSKYLDQYIKTEIFQKELWRRIIHVAFPKKINLGEIGKCSVGLPGDNEQKKIASFLTVVDEKIGKMEEKKAALVEYKKGAMQKIFSQEVRFKGEGGESFPDWEEKRLGEVSEFFSGGTPKTTERSYYSGGTIPFIKSGEISSVATNQKITEDAVRNSSAKFVERGDLLYALYGATSGEVGIAKISGAINQAVLCIRCDCDRYYLYSRLSFDKARILEKYLQGGQGNLSANIIRRLVIGFPVLNEQKKIAEFLTVIDERIKVVEEEIESMKEWKRGLLQKMFV